MSIKFDHGNKTSLSSVGSDEKEATKYFDEMTKIIFNKEDKFKSQTVEKLCKLLSEAKEKEYVFISLAFIFLAEEFYKNDMILSYKKISPVQMLMREDPEHCKKLYEDAKKEKDNLSLPEEIREGARLFYEEYKELFDNTPEEKEVH